MRRSLPPCAALLAVLLAVLVAPPSRAGAQATATVPFEYEDARLYVPVRVNDGPVRWFILDTGAEPTVLDVGLADALGLAVTDAGAQTGAGRGSMRQGRTRDVRLRVGEVPLVAPTAVVGPIDSTLARFTGRAAPGIVGSQFFREHVVEIDFRTRTLTLHAPATYRYRGTGVVVPLRMWGGVPIVDGALVAPGGRKISARLLVDLGTKATLLVAEPFIVRNRLMDAFPRRVVNTLGAGIGGETRYAFVRLPRLAVGAGDGVAADGVVAGLSVEGTLRSEGYDALLGAEFLRRHRVIFDYARDRMILEPSPAAGPPAELDMSGAYFTAHGPARRRFEVLHVVDGSPAAEAGLREGDELVLADGRAAGDYTLGALRDLLRSGAGREVRLVVARGGERLERVVRLRRLV